MQGGKRVAGGMAKYGGHGSFLMRSRTVVERLATALDRNGRLTAPAQHQRIEPPRNLQQTFTRGRVHLR
jgi:hypothetical protein